MVNATICITCDELHASSHYLVVLAQPLVGIAEVDEILVLREECDGTKRFIVPTLLIGEVIQKLMQVLVRHMNARRMWWNDYCTLTVCRE